WEHAAAVLAGGASLALFWNFDRILDGAVQEEVTQAHQALTPHITWDTNPVPEDGLLDRWPATDLAGLAAVSGVEARPFRGQRVLPGRQSLESLAPLPASRVLEPGARAELSPRIGLPLPGRVPLAEDTVLSLARRAS